MAYAWDGRWFEQHQMRVIRVGALKQTIKTSRVKPEAQELIRTGELTGPVLVIRGGGMGDVLMTTPLVRAISKQYGVPVDVLTWEPNLPIFEGNPYVRLTMTECTDASEYTAIIDLITATEHFNESRSLCWQRAAGVFYEDESIDYFITDAERRDAKKILNFKAKTKSIAYIWSSTTPNRNWSNKTHQSNLLALIDDGYTVIVISKESQNIPEGVIDFTGRETGIRELAGVIDTCSATVTPDTGPFFLASALNKPIFAYFGPFSPELRPTGKTQLTLLNNPSICEYAPCQRYDCPLSDFESPCLATTSERMLESIRVIVN